MINLYQNTRHHTPEGSSLHSQSGENIKPKISSFNKKLTNTKKDNK